MTDTPDKKPKTLSLKPRQPEAASATKNNAGSTRVKSGARAHQKARLATEAARSQSKPVVEPKGDRKPSRPNTGSSGAGGATRMPSSQRANQRANQPESDERFKFFAPCPRGLEQALADELVAMGLDGVAAANAGCRFQGRWRDGWRANLHSRLATRMLVELAHGSIRHEDDLRALALQTNWERWMGPKQTLRVDTSAIRSPMKSLQYCNLVVKDSICDRLRDREGERPSIDTVRPDVRVHSFLSADTATLYLDTSGESLFKRGWRFDKAEAPIRENLAAGLLSLSGWQTDQALLDPFCGSATILIEAAWKAMNIAPGINRPFAFERLRGHDARAWQAMRQEATDLILPAAPAPIMGSDLSPQAIEAARANLRRAGLRDDAIELKVADACELSAPAERGVIVTNPPYGERLALEDDLMLRWAAQLKRQFAGWRVNVISADLALPGAMHLKPKRKVPLFNGALDCRLFMFEMVASHYDNKKSSI